MQLDMKMAASVAPGMGMPMASALKIGQYHTLWLFDGEIQRTMCDWYNCAIF